MLSAGSPCTSFSSVSTRFSPASSILHHGRQRRIDQTRRPDVVVAHDGDVRRHVDAGLLQRTKRAHGDQIARRNDGIKTFTAAR